MTETEFRDRICAEAITWEGTPYSQVGRLKKVGVNCAQLLYGVALGAGVLPTDSPEPRWYTAQFAHHSKEEKLAEYIKAYGGREITEAEVQPGDFLVYKTGLSHGHAAIVIDWPRHMIQCRPGIGCYAGHGLEGALGGMHRIFFTLWNGEK